MKFNYVSRSKGIIWETGDEGEKGDDRGRQSSRWTDCRARRRGSERKTEKMERAIGIEGAALPISDSGPPIE